MSQFTLHPRRFVSPPPPPHTHTPQSTRVTPRPHIQDESARVALCDNQNWLPVVVLLGLVSCSVPPLLKAELLLTLAAFAKSPEITASLWQSIEVSQVIHCCTDNLTSFCIQGRSIFRNSLLRFQILPTLPSPNMHQPGGIQV